MSFDWTTFFFELVNFVVLAWLLGRFVIRPIGRSVKSRRDEIAAVRAEAERRLAEVDQRSRDVESRSREIDRMREHVFSEATAEAASERARLMSQAREDAASERERVHALLDSEREAALEWVRDVAVDRGAEVAGRLLLELVPDAAHLALMERLNDEIRRRGDALGSEQSPAGAEVDLSVAHHPTPEILESLRDVLADVLGTRPQITVHEDERLGAGAVLRVGDRVLDASVAGQLELLRDDARRELVGTGG